MDWRGTGSHGSALEVRGSWSSTTWASVFASRFEFRALFCVNASEDVDGSSTVTHVVDVTSRLARRLLFLAL